MNEAQLPFGEVVYRQIRGEIIMGGLAPGARLRLDRLRERYAASTGTLREALSRLAADGFVRAEGQRGFEVAPVSIAGLREIAGLRLLLEDHALARAFDAGGLDWEAAVIAAHHKLSAHEARLDSGDAAALAAWRRADWAFHQALIAPCGSRVLMQSHAEVFDRYLRYQMVAMAFRPEDCRLEHRQLMEAVLQRDAPRARALLRTHIEAGVEQAARRMASSAPPG